MSADGERTDREAPGFEALLAAVRARRSAGTRRIGRLFGPARLAVVAAWARESPRPLVLLTAHDRDLLTSASDLEVWLEAVGARRPVLRLPGPAVNPYAGVAPHAEVLALRATALAALAQPAADNPPLVIASAAGALCRTVQPGRLRSAGIDVRRGTDAAPAEIAARLTAAGYRYEDPVSGPGDFARRGGIVDFFPVDRDFPVRVEFGFEGIESIREFEVDTQRAGEHAARPEAVVAPPSWEWIGAELGEGPHPAFRLPGSSEFGSGFDAYLDEADLVLADPDRFWEAAETETTRVVDARLSAREFAARAAAPPELLLVGIETLRERLELPPPSGAIELRELETTHPGAAASQDLPARPADSFRNRTAEFLNTLKVAGDPRRTVHVFVPGAPAAGRFASRAREAGARVRDQEAAGASAPPETPGAGPAPPQVFVHAGRLSAGFEFPDLHLEVISGAAMVAAPPRTPRRRARSASFLSDFRDLKPGDPVVHTDHGVGRFIRMTRLGNGDDAPELVEIHYAKGGKLFLPVDRLDLLEKYTAGSAAGAPPLDRLGGTSWVRRRKRVAKAMRDIAGELIRLYAARRRIAGTAFSRDTPGMDEFEDGFEWTETEDQARAIRDVFEDMEADAPMDRLLAGDVGFGKTEVALRAAFKAAMDGKQVAILVPTTVLAAQHARVFERRFAAFPIQVALLSRFRTPKQQKEVVAGVQDGTVDIVIGTHRLLSKDVAFRDLGLLIVDEEQRFGVSAKERLKAMAPQVDHLAMTATPIPRTLNMSLSGIRDMSVIETAPRDRMAIQTHVLPFDPDRIAEAVRHELAREGQVYFVHNRVRSLPAMAKLLENLIPEARILIAHGQLREAALERTLIRFQEHEADILLTTTIIENGIDLPRVNTLLVNRADAFGLAQLYQIRGRVGRSSRRAYAYLLVPQGAPLSGGAQPRLAALREFSELGAGFRIAALDMELRGTGNLLGAAQHGHLEAVGFDLYYRLLEEAVAEARGEQPRSRCAMNLRFQFRIPGDWLEDIRRRMWLYKRCSSAADLDTLDRLRDEVRDRFGALPAEVELLFQYVRLRIRAEALGYTAIHREGDSLRFEADAEDRAFRSPLAPGAGPAEVLGSLQMALSALEAVALSRARDEAADQRVSG
jgi:transcription-repair coupling factor (superfamily II helicase)